MPQGGGGGSGAPADPLRLVRERLADSARVLQDTAEGSGDAICAAGRTLAGALAAGRRVLAFGNGGSAADAEHFAAELAGRFERDRPGLAVEALAASGVGLTAIANDYGFEQVFARLVEARGREGDVAFALSTSGESRNVLAAAAVARERGLSTVALVGSGGGKLAAAVDVAVVVPSNVTARIQEAHIAICHVLCELVDEALLAERELS